MKTVPTLRYLEPRWEERISVPAGRIAFLGVLLGFWGTVGLLIVGAV